MNLSLREARKLETRIQAKINEGVVSGRALNIHESFLESFAGGENLELTAAWLAETFAMGDDSIVSMVGLVEVRSALRRLVQATNEEVLVNELIAERKRLIQIRSLWGEVIHSYDLESGHAMTADVLQRVATSAVESAKNSSSVSRYGRQIDSLTVSAISDELYEQANVRTRQLLREIDGIEDQLSVLNATTKITLDSLHVDFLKEEDLL